MYSYSPEQDLGPLFKAVQLTPLFCDSKFFTDSDPRCCPSSILQIYLQNPCLNLNELVEAYFLFPSEQTVSLHKNKNLSFEDYLPSLWPCFVRSSERACEKITTLIPLPKPYVIPGERFREMYYWDSYFIMLGLSLSNSWDLIEGMLENFAFMMDRYGFIPNGNRTYYLTRSQPPFFSLMVRLYAEHFGMEKALRFLPAMEKEHLFWMEKRKAFNGMNHYDDFCSLPRPESYFEDVKKKRSPEEYRNIRAAAESGWDFSSRWQDEKGTLQTRDILPVDLNCLLYHLELFIAKMNLYQECHEKSHYFFEKARVRKNEIQALFWDEELGYYQDYQYQKSKFTNRPSLAGVFPLLFEISDERQAGKVTEYVEKNFLFSGGLVTSLENTGEQWDFPNGWAPLQWAAVVGLKKYGYTDLAKKIIKNWLFANELQFNQTAMMLEKYNVVDPESVAGGGEYPNQIGFGWTNGVALYFRSLLSEEGELIEKKNQTSQVTKQ